MSSVTSTGTPDTSVAALQLWVTSDVVLRVRHLALPDDSTVYEASVAVDALLETLVDADVAAESDELQHQYSVYP